MLLMCSTNFEDFFKTLNENFNFNKNYVHARSLTFFFYRLFPKTLFTMFLILQLTFIKDIKNRTINTMLSLLGKEDNFVLNLMTISRI